MGEYFECEWLREKVGEKGWGRELRERERVERDERKAEGEKSRKVSERGRERESKRMKEYAECEWDWECEPNREEREQKNLAKARFLLISRQKMSNIEQYIGR